MKEKVFLIDGSGYIFRAYFGIRPLTSKKGVPTNAVYGFATMLLKLIKEQKPKYLAIAFDTKEKTFRHDLYDQYKANRPPAPDDLIPQFPLIHSLVDALQIPRLVIPGYEADDLLGTMARRATEAGHEVVIVTGDKDLMQLVTPQVAILDEMRGAHKGGKGWVDAQAVEEKFGVPPDKVIEVLALMGDSSDNVPGVKGIGQKTAALLIQEYGTVENVLANIENIKQKGRREKLDAGRDMALLSKQLVTIPTDIPLDIALSDLLYQRDDDEPLIRLFQELSFERLLKDPALNLSASSIPVANDKQEGLNDVPITKSEFVQKNTTITLDKYTQIQTKAALDELVKVLEGASIVAIDTETDSLTPTQANLLGLSVSWEEGEAAYIPIAHNTDEAQLPWTQVQARFKVLFDNPEITWVAQNGKYDQLVLSRAGLDNLYVHGDPMIASYLLYADGVSHSLDEMSARHLNHQPIAYNELCGSGKDAISFADVPLQKQLHTLRKMLI